MLPLEFKQQMQEILGEDEYQKFLKSYELSPNKGIRANRLKIDRDQLKELLPEIFEAQDIPWTPDGIYINPEERPGKQPGYYTGLYYPQEPSAMTPAQALDVEEGDLILDLCAAPGGKSTQIASKLGDNGSLIFNEIVKNRVGILAENVERMGIKNAVILNEHPERLIKNFKERFDKILVDAPCSGEGMFRKDSAVIDEYSPDRPESCSVKQSKILETVDKLLKPGGEIVYSTCTFSPLENELVIQDFLDKYDYELLDTGLEGINDVKVNIPNVRSEILEKTTRIWPQVNEGEGHFVAKLKKGGMPGRIKKNKNRNTNLKRAGKKDLTDYNNFRSKYIPEVDYRNLYIYQDKLINLPEAIGPEDLAGLKVHSAGLELGEFKKNRFEPSHSLAMSLKKDEFTNTYELSEDELWSYLKGEELKPETVLDRGWVLLCYDGYPVGFGKYSGTIKNKYPKGLRIYKK